MTALLNMQLSIVFDLLITIAEIFMLDYFLSGLCKNKRIGKIHIKILIYLMLLLSVSMITHMISFLPFKFVIKCMLIVLFSKVMYRVSYLSLTFYCIIYMVVIIACEVLMGVFFQIFFDRIFYGYETAADFELVLLIKIVSFILLLFLKKSMVRTVLKDTISYEIVLIIIANISNLSILMYLSYLLQLHVRIPNHLLHIITFVTLLLLVSFISSILLAEHYTNIKKKQRAYEIEVYTKNLQCSYYEDKIKDEKEIRSLYHDMKNHLLIINDQIEESNSITKYVDVLQKQIEKYDKYINTNNKYADIIFKEKIARCKNHEISFHIKMDLTYLNFLKPIDICIIFSNLLDNAIEACIKITNADNRYIEIKANRENSNFIIKCTNSYLEEPMYDGKQLVSSKADQNNHGIGISNVTQVIHNYNGYSSIKAENNVFNFYIVIPIAT